MTTWLRRGLWTLLLLVTALACGAALYAWQALPRVDGEIGLPDWTGAPVRIERDAHGIPTIRAATPEAALYGLGFAHAQDRLWQLETHRRIAAGRLAEAFGPGAVETDKFLRALGVRRAAARQWAVASPETRSAVLAYTDGINAYLTHALKARPPEMLVLGVQPEPWTPEDTLGWTIMMAWDLGGNWTQELLRMRLALQMPVERINQLIPPYPGDSLPATADYAALFRSLRVDGALGKQALLSAPESGIEGVGSNNWVLAGARTTTGKPLLANDPHLKITTPALWYFARLDAPGLKVAGATMPGLPGVVLGQNEHVAWGFTNTNPDVQDLYLERVSEDDPAQYQTPDGWARFETFDETIKVRGAADVNLTVRSTRHGPVISDVGGASEGLTGNARGPAYVLAMRWVALDTDADLLRAPIAANRWRSVNDFVANAGFFVAPMQNIVVADSAGHIALLSPGRVPVRGPRHDLHGLVPAPGWDARYDWTGFVPVSELPQQVNPPQAWAGSANQRIHEPGYPHFIATDWAPPFRMQRIGELIEAKPKHDLASLRAMQGDEVSLAARRLLPHLQKAKAAHPLAAAAQRELQGFDGTMAAERAAPLIYWAWMRQLTQALLADDMGQALYDRHVGWRNFREAVDGILERNDAGWCDDRRTPAAESCEQQIDAAFARALDELQAEQGADVATWQWGRAHVARAEHRPFSNIGLLARWFELRTPVGGDTHTINVSRVVMKPEPRLGGLPYRTEHAPSLRALYDLADPSQSRVMHSTGQSGLVFSGGYQSFLNRWRAVEDLPLWPQEPARDVLTLRASGPS